MGTRAASQTLVGQAGTESKVFWQRKGTAWAKVVRCLSGWDEGARGVVWEQVRLERKQGPDPPGFAGPTRSCTVSKDDQE